MNKTAIREAKKLFCKAAEAGGLSQDEALADLEASIETSSAGAIFAPFFTGMATQNKLPRGVTKNHQKIEIANQLLYVSIRDLAAVVISLAVQDSSDVVCAISDLAGAVQSFVQQHAERQCDSDRGMNNQKPQRRRTDWSKIDPIIEDFIKSHDNPSSQRIADAIKNKLKINISRQSIDSRRKKLNQQPYKPA